MNSNRTYLFVILVLLAGILGVLVINYRDRQDSVGNSVGEVVEEIGDEIDDNTDRTP